MLDGHRVPDWISDKQLEEWVGEGAPGCHIPDPTLTNHVHGEGVT